MKKPTSFRLDTGLLARLEAEAQAGGITVSSLVTSLLQEGLQMRRFPGIVYRSGPAGRRAGVAGGPDVWELIRDFNRISGPVEKRVQALSKQTGAAPKKIRLALDFYAGNREEVDRRIKADAEAAAALKETAQRRERLAAG